MEGDRTDDPDASNPAPPEPVPGEPADASGRVTSTGTPAAAVTAERPVSSAGVPPGSTPGGSTGPSARTRRTEVLIGVLLVALLAGFGVAAGVGLTPSGLPATGAARFVPADAVRGFGTLTEGTDSAPAMVENARLNGDQLTDGVPGSLTELLTPPPGATFATTHWWREGLVVTGFTRPSQRYRIRSVTAAGVRLHGQEWGGLGIVFSPALLELPSSVRPGQVWRSSGQAVADPVDRLLDYRSTVSARVAADRDDAASGCLQTDNRTELVPESGGTTSVWTEQELWCPGRGVVAASGDLHGTRYALARTTPQPPDDVTGAGLSVSPAPGGPVGHWRTGGLRIDDGDDTFGDHRASLVVDGTRLISDGTGTLHLIDIGALDVRTVTPLTDGSLWAHGWLRPGGPVTAMAARGRIVVVATADRGLYLYDFAGRLHWQRRLPDVPVVSPVLTPDGRVLVTTVSGTALMIDIRTAAILWSTRLPAPVDAQPALSGSVALVPTTDGQTTALDLADGSVLWQHQLGSVTPAVAVVDGVAVSMTFGQLTGRDLADGRLRWARTGLGDADSVHDLGGTVVVLGDDQVLGVDPRTGADRWRRRLSTLDALGYGDGRFLLTSTEVLAIGDDGRTTASWPLAAPLDRAVLLPGAGQLLALGRHGQTLAGSWVGPAAPGSS